MQEHLSISRHLTACVNLSLSRRTRRLDLTNAASDYSIESSQPEISRLRHGRLVAASSFVLHAPCRQFGGLAIDRSLPGNRRGRQSDAADQVYIRNERLARVGVFLIGELPGLILLGISARTDRWRQAVMALWLTRLMDVSMAGLFAANLIKVSSTEPNLLTIAIWHLRIWLVWIDAWSLCVIIAEFAHIFRVNRVVEMTENLGKLIVVAALFNAALTAYSVPRGFPPFLDETTATLCFITLALMLTCEIWIFVNLTLGATVARLARRKLDEQPETVR